MSGLLLVALALAGGPRLVGGAAPPAAGWAKAVEGRDGPGG